MKKHFSIGLLSVALLLTACVQPLTPEQKGWTNLDVWVAFPGMAETKGTVGQLPASDLEKAIHTLKIWVFLSDETHAHVASLTIDPGDFPMGENQRRYSLPVTKVFASQRPAVDIFVLANQEALGFNFQTASDAADPDAAYAGASWSQLYDATFGDTQSAPYHGFGLNDNSPVHTVDPSLGLPMTGYGPNKTINGQEPALSVQTIQLERVVSRIRFVFCKTYTEWTEEIPDNEAAIQSVVLNGGVIPKQEYLFSSSPFRIVMTDPENENYNPYLSDSYTIFWPEDPEHPGTPLALAENEAPENLVYVNQDPITYENLLATAIEAGQLTDLGYTYFRESDKLLSGLIHYSTKVDGVTKPDQREFKMLENGDFARNHTWTVFGYFLSGRNLQLSVSVMPWDYNKHEVDFDDQSVICNSKFLVIGGAANGNGTGEPMSEKDHVRVRVGRQQPVRCSLSVVAPRGGTLYIQPLSQHPEFFNITPVSLQAPIDPDAEQGKVSITVALNPDYWEDPNAPGTELTFDFHVELGDRMIQGASEIIDKHYHFVI